MARLGFVGLGTMGAPMAGHLASKFADTLVWSRNPERSKPLADQGIAVAETLTELAANCHVVFLCVNRSEDVEECVTTILARAEPGCTIVDHSTISPTAAIEIHSLVSGAGCQFLDAPITGGSMGAKSGKLTIFCGGEQQVFDSALPFMSAYAKRAELVGGSGAGQMMKAANQIAVAGSLIGLCEALAFAKKAGLDLAQTRDLLSGGAAGSWAMENYGPKILEGDWSPGFSVKNQRKDFAYCREAANTLDAAIPMTLLVDALLKKLQDVGHEEWATCALYEVLLELGASD